MVLINRKGQYRTVHLNKQTGVKIYIWRSGPPPGQVAQHRAQPNRLPSRLPVRRRVGTRSRSARFRFDPNRMVHDAQAQCDSLVQPMPKDWLSQPPIAGQLRVAPDLEPRGIKNPGNYCYQNSVYQALMHTPVFLHWICTHVRTTNCNRCVKCSMKPFIQEYWGSTPSSIPIDPNARFLRDIRAAAWHSGMFTEGFQEDAGEFYNWLIWQFNDLDNPHWEEEWVALFGMNSREWRTCRTCGAETQGGWNPPDTSLEIPVDAAVHDVGQAVKRFFGYDEINFTCAQCSANRDHIKRVEIQSAPRILRVTLKIFNLVNDAITKDLREYGIEEYLDLTQYQEHDAVPLRYALSSVISHQGDNTNAGHYIASVRTHKQCHHRFYNISDERKEYFDIHEFLGAPQQPQNHPGTDFHVYTLTYLRDEEPVENLNQWSNGRAVNSLRNTARKRDIKKVG